MSGEPKDKKKFEYKRINPMEVGDCVTVMDALNTLGDDGWQLVNMTKHYRTGDELWTLMREIQCQ